MAWEGTAPTGPPRRSTWSARALSLFEPVDLTAQLVHGDLSGNVLRDGDRPS